MTCRTVGISDLTCIKCGLQYTPTQSQEKEEDSRVLDQSSSKSSSNGSKIVDPSEELEKVR